MPFLNIWEDGLDLKESVYLSDLNSKTVNRGIFSDASAWARGSEAQRTEAAARNSGRSQAMWGKECTLYRVVYAPIHSHGMG